MGVLCVCARVGVCVRARVRGCAGVGGRESVFV